MDRARKEREYFWERWEEDYGQGDPYYNPNLSLLHFDFRPKENRQDEMMGDTF